MMPLPKPGPMPSCGPQERQAVDGDHGRYGRAHRGPARIERPRSCALATMAGQPPPKPCRNAEASGETSGPAPHGAGGDGQVAKVQVGVAVLKGFSRLGTLIAKVSG